MTLWWLSDDSLMTFWRLSDYSLTTLTTLWWLWQISDDSENPLTALWQPSDSPLTTLCYIVNLRWLAIILRWLWLISFWKFYLFSGSDKSKKSASLIKWLEVISSKNVTSSWVLFNWHSTSLDLSRLDITNNWYFSRRARASHTSFKLFVK